MITKPIVNVTLSLLSVDTNLVTDTDMYDTHDPEWDYQDEHDYDRRSQVDKEFLTLKPWQQRKLEALGWHLTGFSGTASMLDKACALLREYRKMNNNFTNQYFSDPTLT